ncbi:MAG: hemolysin family protein [Gammaproteobacteria bacterium SHHR-1]|uniref:hemolysin family protein n=1 Tax=Magnetovirga frankeli TaxID=947516 RepID=UPI00129363B6|nr:HlyC/CorC family transporter [gamma proteobacterium SS-5]
MNDIFSLAGLLILSGFFSGSETALVTLSVARAEALAKEGRAGAKALVQLKRNPTRMLITILIGNNVVNIAASALATLVATKHLGGHLGPGVAVGVLTFLILIFGEITPKSLATRFAERISLLASPPIYALERLLTPLVWFFEGIIRAVHRMTGTNNDPTITELELINLAGHGEVEGTIEREEREMIERIFNLNDLVAADVMTPSRDVFQLDCNLSIETIIDLIDHQSYSRIPLFNTGTGEIVKILQLRDILHALANKRYSAQIGDLGHEPVFCPENQPIGELLSSLRKSKQHMAVVVNEHGAMQGVVTLEDLLEEVVGEIYDESDDLPDEYMLLAEGKILVDGSTELRVVENFFDIDLPGKPTDTVSLWILEDIERIPDEDEQFEIDGLKVLIQGASNSRIEQIIVERVPPKSEEEE